MREKTGLNTKMSWRYGMLWEETLEIPRPKEDVLDQLVSQGETWRGRNYVAEGGIYFTRNYLDENRFRFFRQVHRFEPTPPRGGPKFIVEDYFFFVEVDACGEGSRVRIAYLHDRLKANLVSIASVFMLAVAALNWVLMSQWEDAALERWGLTALCLLMIPLFRVFGKMYGDKDPKSAWPALDVFLRGLGWSGYEDRQKNPPPRWASGDDGAAPAPPQKESMS